MHWEEEPLDLGIEIPEAHHLAEGEKAKKKAKIAVRWATYRPSNPIHCDECLLIAHKLWPDKNCIPKRAVLKRTYGSDTTYWCSEHGESAKREDGYSRGR